MLDYETLRLIWWLLIGIILVAFMVTDGFDMGVGCLLPLIARNDDERRVLINSVGAHWEGNGVAHSGGRCIIRSPATRLCCRIFGVLCGDDSGAVRPFLSSIGL